MKQKSSYDYLDISTIISPIPSVFPFRCFMLSLLVLVLIGESGVLLTGAGLGVFMSWVEAYNDEGRRGRREYKSEEDDEKKKEWERKWSKAFIPPASSGLWPTSSFCFRFSWHLSLPFFSLDIYRGRVLNTRVRKGIVWVGNGDSRRFMTNLIQAQTKRCSWENK